MKNKISHDKNGRKVFSDSIVYDQVANEYFIPVKVDGLWGDEFLGDFYPLDPSSIVLIKRHATMKDLYKMMNDSKDGSVYNVNGDFNA